MTGAHGRESDRSRSTRFRRADPARSDPGFPWGSARAFRAPDRGTERFPEGFDCFSGPCARKRRTPHAQMEAARCHLSVARLSARVGLPDRAAANFEKALGISETTWKSARKDPKLRRSQRKLMRVSEIWRMPAAQTWRCRRPNAWMGSRRPDPTTGRAWTFGSPSINQRPPPVLLPKATPSD